MNSMKYRLMSARKRCGPIGLCVLLVWSFGNKFADRGLVPHLAYAMLDLLVVRIVANSRVPRQVRLGARVGFVHDASGVILHPEVRIGDDCTIYHQVTIGAATDRPGAPRLGNGVLIGAGAKILGPITIGDGAAVGANAVVLRDVPPGATVVGAPARIVRTGDPSRIRR